ncbi:hypothetical protein AB5Q63_001979 [Vibrio parahaemolyticus]|nr:hypothetical protein [Vibrio parahaemolyticus]EHW0648112.1 hypothetical protein [Vibrio parahaemolyticus]
MADKYFKLTCNKKVSHKAVKESGDLEPVIHYIKATTQELAKSEAVCKVEATHPLCTENENSGYSDFFKGVKAEKISEEDYNAAIIELEAKGVDEGEFIHSDEQQINVPDTPYPTLGQDGYYDTKDPQVEDSSFIYSSETDSMKAAKVFILRVGHSQYAYGFRFKFGDFDKHEKMNLDRTEEKRDDAIDKAVERLEKFLDYQDEFGPEDQKNFISATMKHDFYHAFLEPSELFITALSQHPDAKNALEAHSDYLEVVEGHFADIWPLDKSPNQAIEHVNSMVTIGVLYDLEAFTESLKPYLPAVLTEKTKESMKHIEDVIDKPAANEYIIEPNCWKAALPVTDESHVVIAIRDCGDEGWQYAVEGNQKAERAFGDANDFGCEFATTRKEAIKMAGQAIIDALYKYDSSLSLAKIFMKSPYIQEFEENCIEVMDSEDLPPNECSPIENVVRERLARRPTARMTEGEVKLAMDALQPHITAQTDIEELVETINGLERCGVLFNESEAEYLVARCTVTKNNIQHKPAHNLENEYECFIAEIFSRISDGSPYLTTEQYEEAGEKLAAVVDELTNWHNGEREHNGKYLTFVKDKTLENIRNIDFDDASEVSKSFLNIRTLRAVFRENIELIESMEPASNTLISEVEHPSLLLAIAERLAHENHAVTPERAYTHLLKIITKDTDINALADYIKQLKNPVIIWHSTESVNLVMKFTGQPKADGNNELSSGNNEQKEAQKLPEQGKKEPTDGNGKPKVTKNAPLPESANDEHLADSDNNISGTDVPQNIVEQEPANDPEIPDVDLDESNSNMGIWNQSFKTDLNFTKQDPSTGRLSINAQYRQMKATEIFGPRGKGWGVDVKREWIEDGLPIFANGTYTGVNESVHNMEVELWYIHPNSGERCTLTAFGETERFYWSHNYSRMIKNGECRKKSLTDATGKALSMLGICGDVYMGEYDDENIINRSQMTKTTDNALKQLEFDAKATQQALDKAKSYTDKFSTAPSLAEIKRLQKLAETALDAIPTHDKASKAKKDKALSRIAEQAESAIKDFNADIKDKDQANG